MVGDLLDPADLHRAVEGVSVVVYIGPPMHPVRLRWATAW